jgi:hypothetical protein
MASNSWFSSTLRVTRQLWAFTSTRAHQTGRPSAFCSFQSVIPVSAAHNALHGCAPNSRLRNSARCANETGNLPRRTAHRGPQCHQAFRGVPSEFSPVTNDAALCSVRYRTKGGGGLGWCRDAARRGCLRRDRRQAVLLEQQVQRFRDQLGSVLSVSARSFGCWRTAGSCHDMTGLRLAPPRAAHRGAGRCSRPARRGVPGTRPPRRGAPARAMQGVRCRGKGPPAALIGGQALPQMKG